MTVFNVIGINKDINFFGIYSRQCIQDHIRYSFRNMSQFRTLPSWIMFIFVATSLQNWNLLTQIISHILLTLRFDSSLVNYFFISNMSSFPNFKASSNVKPAWIVLIKNVQCESSYRLPVNKSAKNALKQWQHFLCDYKHIHPLRISTAICRVCIILHIQWFFQFVIFTLSIL